MRINYVIASWSGPRVHRADMLFYERVLQNHLNVLKNIKHNLSQITIMRPFNNFNNNYYNINLVDSPEWLHPTKNLKIIKCENRYQSYGQWLKCVELFVDEFDYFIFIEDDYVPNIDNFDKLLIDLYEEDTYLCSYAGIGVDSLLHSMISNGIISSNTIKKVLLKEKYNIWFDNYCENYPKYCGDKKDYQIIFSRYLYDNGVNLKDYRDYYKVSYYANGVTRDCSNSPKYDLEIFTPIQNIKSFF